MKKIAILAISLMFVGGGAFAQTPTTPRIVPPQGKNMQVHQKKTPEERAEQMKKDYNLTDQQTSELTEFFKKQQEQRAEQMKNAQNKREEMGNNKKENEQVLQKILGDENYKKFMEQRDARMKENRECFKKDDNSQKQCVDGQKPLKRQKNSVKKQNIEPAKVKSAEMQKK
ncbi:MAG: hypothetical protein FWD66_05950 [Paludibacter sp.]|nr:hypothetical protein [Paludibacter sp.]